MVVALQRPKRPQVRSQIVSHHAEGEDGAERMIEQITERIAATPNASRSTRTVDLVVGENRVVHNLGRKVTGCNLAPTVADATFAWSLRPDGDRYAVITVVGVDQPACPIEFW